MRGKAVALTVLIFTGTLGSVATLGFGGADEPHAPIELVGDQAFRQNVCSCIRNPNASGTAADPFIISDWRINTHSGAAIEVRNIDEVHFRIRDNTIEADEGIRLINTGDRGGILNNVIRYRETGIFLKNSATHVELNTIEGTRPMFYWPGDRGILADGGSPMIQGNTISSSKFGIVARTSSATIQENHLTGAYDGIKLLDSARGELIRNTLRLSEHYGLVVEDSAHATLRGNDIRGGNGGIIAEDATLLYMVNNTVTNQERNAIRFTGTEVKMFRNTIADNWQGAVGSKSSDLLMQENIFRNNGGDTDFHGGDAISLVDTKGAIVGNLIEKNEGTGIALKHSIVDIDDNRLYNNSFGLSIPYGSKQSIPKMERNIVNGVNVDGALVPSEKRLFYKTVGAEITDQTIDSGFDEGFYGTLTEQGALILYDTSATLVQNVTFKEHNPPDDADGKGRAIFVHHGFNIRIRDNTFRNNEEAVLAVDARIFIKDNECDIDIDPPSACFVVKGGFASVRANVVANVEVGIWFTEHDNEPARGIIVDNEISATTRNAIRLKGDGAQTEHDVKVDFNRLEANVIGMVLIDFHGNITSNEVRNSTWAAVHLDAGSNATFFENRIVANAKGIVDVEICGGGSNDRCSGGEFFRNVIKANGEIGVELGAGGSFKGDLITKNKVGARVHGGTVMEGVNISSNNRVGLEATGRIGVHDSNASSNGHAGIVVEGLLRMDGSNASFNGRDGITVNGRVEAQGSVAFNNSGDGFEIMGSADLDETNTSGNARAGMRLAGTVFFANDCESSFNSDGVIMADVMAEVDADLGIEIVVPEPELPENGDDEDQQDPLFMHDCDVVANSDYAVKASANTIVNATNNFWGKKGPKLDLPIFEGDNVISDHVIASPYWETRAHEEKALIPTTEGGGPGGPDTL